LSITPQQKLAEVRRELALRERVYRKWVADGKMKFKDAEARIAIMQAIAHDYEKWCAKLERESGPATKEDDHGQKDEAAQDNADFLRNG